jgi:thiol-disulfide isomerase/thioredoxin
MNTFSKALFLVVISATSSFANAESAPFSQDAFTKAQQHHEKILLHFNADWDPICKTQSKVLSSLQNDSVLKNVKVFIVNFDKEQVLEKTIHVEYQATLVSFQGTRESGRITGLTSPIDIKDYIDSSLTNPETH